MIVDTSHITMKGFWDIAEAGLPLVATHSNAYAVCPVTRNLTDDQLRVIAETGGMAGLNFGAILDAAGEGHAFDAHWVFTECQKRDLPLMVACCVNEPQVGGLIDRALNIGRLPDAMTFCASYEQMPIAATHFFGRGDVRAALREGRLDAMGIHPGQFDKRSLTEPGKFMPFPDLRVLNKDSDGALVVPTGPSPRAVMEDKIDRLAQANLPEYLLQAALIGTVLWRDAAIDWVPPDLSQLAGWRT